MFGRCVDTLIRYERAGRIPRPRRDAAGHRRYTADEIEAIRAALNGPEDGARARLPKGEGPIANGVGALARRKRRREGEKDE